MPNQYATITHVGEPTPQPHDGTVCGHFPEFTRLKYFYGQMLGQHDFQTEQDYFREKLRLHNRCLHGYGTVCGLEVVPEEMEKDCPHPSHDERTKLEAELKEVRKEIKELKKTGPRGQEEDYKIRMAELESRAEKIQRGLAELPEHECIDATPTRVRINCGLALDCDGNELIIRQAVSVDLWQSLSREERKSVDEEGQVLYVSLCYCAMPVDPVRPVLMDTCGASPECVYGKLRDSVKVTVSLERPETDDRCEACCGSCADACLLLARIDGFKRGEELKGEQVDNSVRRMVGPYSAATVSGISWTHGAEYTPDEARQMLGVREEHGGLEIQFSRPVLTASLARGVVDLWVIEGGLGKSGNIYHLAGDYVDLPTTETTASVKFRQMTRESLQEGDRVLIIARTSFILDECCHPVDGDHIGGRVPLLKKYENYRRGEPHEACTNPPQRTVPWTSGNGTGGGTFESWFYIKSDGAGEA